MVFSSIFIKSSFSKGDQLMHSEIGYDHRALLKFVAMIAIIYSERPLPTFVWWKIELCVLCCVDGNINEPCTEENFESDSCQWNQLHLDSISLVLGAIYLREWWGGGGSRTEYCVSVHVGGCNIDVKWNCGLVINFISLEDYIYVWMKDTINSWFIFQ